MSDLVRWHRSRTVTPKPSASLIAMQKRGLELVVPRRVSHASTLTSGNGSQSLETSDQNKPLPLEPEDTVRTIQGATFINSQDTPTSTYSRYSIDSSSSTHSEATGDTTISQIVDLYTDLIENWSTEDEVEGTSDIPILQPQAHRDTIAPLLQNTLSLSRSPTPSVTTAGTTQQSEGISWRLPIFQDISDTDGKTNFKNQAQKAPSFTEFSRALVDRRNNLLVPRSESPSTYNHASTNDISPLATPFSQTLSVGQSSYFPSPQSTSGNNTSGINLEQPSSIALDQSLNTGEGDEIWWLQKQGNDTLGRPGPTIRISPPREGPHTHRRVKTIDQSRNQLMSHPDGGRYYDDRSDSIQSTSAESTKKHNGLAGSIKDMIRIRLENKKHMKDDSEVQSTDPQGNSTAKFESSRRKLSWTQTQRSSIKIFNAAIRQSTLSSPSEPALTASTRRREPAPPAIQLTPYQKYGPEVLKVEAKKARKELKRQKRNLSNAQRLSNENHDTSSQDRTNVLSYQSGPNGGGRVDGKKGWRHGFGKSGVKKRQEGSAGRIVIVGPPKVTADYDTVSNKTQ